MLDESSLHGLAQNVAPSGKTGDAIKSRILSRIRPEAALLRAVESVHPSKERAASLKARIFHAIGLDAAADLQTAGRSVVPAAPNFARMKEAVMMRLLPMKPVPLIAGGLKWASAFAVFILALRALPVLLLAPSTNAEVGVQLVPVDGVVSVYVGGVWQEVTSPEVIQSSVMVRTDVGSHATLIMNDDGVFRLGPDTTFKLYDLSDRPMTASTGPTATLVHGQVWALGLVPSFMDGLSVEVSGGTASINSGSVSIEDTGTVSTVTVYDRGATFTHDKQVVFAVSGEKITSRGDSHVDIAILPSTIFTDPYVSDNLQQDAVHRSEIAKLQADRRAQIAGILPTSFLYPAKRLAEEVDVMFTLTADGRTEKRIEQANTRLNEALALIKDGQSDQAAGPMTEYKDSLIAMAGDQNDNLVKYLIEKQIADASTSIGSQDNSPDASVQLLKQAVTDIGAAIPDATLQPKDIEGYVLIDRLAQINHDFSETKDATVAAQEYNEVSPYLQGLLSDESGAHLLLRKEAESMLVTTAALLKENGDAKKDSVVASAETDINQYLPAEQDKVLVTEQQLDDQVKQMMDRIFIFRSERSRYNQLLTEMQNIESDPNRGTLLRRLKIALPYELAQYVNTEIQKLGDELKDQSGASQ